jgi:hypothetical protein
MLRKESKDNIKIDSKKKSYLIEMDVTDSSLCLMTFLMIMGPILTLHFQESHVCRNVNLWNRCLKLNIFILLRCYV